MSYEIEPDVRPDEPKWVVLKRASSQAQWQVHSHHSGTWFRFQTMDHAVSVLKKSFSRQKKSGDALVQREDRVPAYCKEASRG